MKFFPLRCCASNITTFAPKSASSSAGSVCPPFPLYTSNACMYPLLLPARHYTFIAIFVGFIGMYCLRQASFEGNHPFIYNYFIWHVVRYHWSNVVCHRQYGISKLDYWTGNSPPMQSIVLPPLPPLIPIDLTQINCFTFTPYHRLSGTGTQAIAF